MEAVLDRLEATEPPLNAFVTVTAEQARHEARLAEGAFARGGGLARPARWDPGHRQGPDQHRGSADHIRLLAARRPRARPGRHRLGAVEGSRGHPGRQDHDAGVQVFRERRRASSQVSRTTRGASIERPAVPAEAPAGERGGGCRTAGVGERRGWLDPGPGRVLRRGGAQGLRGEDPLPIHVQLPGRHHQRSAGTSSGRHRAGAVRHRRPGCGRSASLPWTDAGAFTAAATEAAIDGLRIAVTPHFGRGPVSASVLTSFGAATSVLLRPRAATSDARMTLPDPIGYFLDFWSPGFAVAMQELRAMPGWASNT